MKNQLTIQPDHLDIVLDILQKYLPLTAQVWAFGSRAKGKIKKFSDLDLLIDLGEKLPLNKTVSLVNAFDESLLPYRVDIVDWHALDESFKKKIIQERIQIWPQRGIR